MTYIVLYKNENNFFWKKIKNVKKDGILKNYPEPTRFFILEDESQIEIPIRKTIFKFSKNRFLKIKKEMEKEINQDIRLRG